MGSHNLLITTLVPFEKLDGFLKVATTQVNFFYFSELMFYISNMLYNLTVKQIDWHMNWYRFYKSLQVG